MWPISLSRIPAGFSTESLSHRIFAQMRGRKAWAIELVTGGHLAERIVAVVPAEVGAGESEVHGIHLPG